MNRILITGIEGYIGRALCHFLNSKHTYFVSGIDNGLRQKNVSLIGGTSLMELSPIDCHHHFDICDYDALKERIVDFEPTTIIHLAEQPSAPFSFISPYQSTYTQYNNVVGTLNVLWAIKETNPNIHLIKLGTAGMYVDWLYKDVTIPESPRITVNYQNKDWEIPTPRYAGSWYHMSKFFDSYNIDYACRIWGLRATDINQGIVYGHMYGTRFDYDQYFGTVINRFMAQALAKTPLTVYGTGHQMRGFINLKNSLEAIELIANNPPVEGEYRIVHQLTQTCTINDLATMIAQITGIGINHISNPRAELPENKFVFEAKYLKDLGLQAVPLREGLEELWHIVKLDSRGKVYTNVIQPTTQWR